MQVTPADLNEGDTILVMGKCVARVLSIEPHADKTIIGARRVVIEVVGVWQGYDTIDLVPGVPVERVQAIIPTTTPPTTEGNGGYA